MKKSITRVIKMDDWFFEVKMVRAIKSKKLWRLLLSHRTIDGKWRADAYRLTFID